MSENKTILAIFAHPDDELGVVGTLANHVAAGDDVYLAFLTYGENASTITGTATSIKERRIEHTNKISDLLGVKIRYLGFPDSLVEYNTENAYKVADLIREVRPNIVISWNKSYRIGSGHPDHRKTSDLVLDAISYARYKREDSSFDCYRERFSYYVYYDPTLNTTGNIVYVDVSEHGQIIKEFIKVYQEAYGDWPVEEYKFGAMAYFGRRALVKYAEVFEQVLIQPNIGKLLE